MTSALQLEWCHSLVQLLDQGILTGFALITAAGPCQPVTGPFQQECIKGVSDSLRALIQPLYSSAEPPKAYELWGQKLIVFHSTEGSTYAIGPRRQLGIGAVQLPAGVLLVSFQRPAQPRVVVSEVERCCSVLRA